MRPYTVFWYLAKYCTIVVQSNRLAIKRNESILLHYCIKDLIKADRIDFDNSRVNLIL